VNKEKSAHAWRIAHQTRQTADALRRQGRDEDADTVLATGRANLRTLRRNFERQGVGRFEEFQFENTVGSYDISSIATARENPREGMNTVNDILGGDTLRSGAGKLRPPGSSWNQGGREDSGAFDLSNWFNLPSKISEAVAGAGGLFGRLLQPGGGLGQPVGGGVNDTGNKLDGINSRLDQLITLIGGG
jgi:hypothetical protein